MRGRIRRVMGGMLMAAWLLGCSAAPTGGGGGEPAPGPQVGNPQVGNPQEPVPQTPSQAVTQTVTVKNFAFTPATVRVPAGSTVVWKFEDSVPHSTTSDPGSPQSWDSGIVGAGATYTVRFDDPGTYPYHCTPHSTQMKGTVMVE